MAYKKRETSSVYDKAKNRLAGMKQFETKLDFGNDLTEEVYLAAMAKVDALTQKNNDLLTEVDGVSTELNEAERALSKLSSRFLKVVGSRYTTNSVQYEKAGGVRDSNIKRGRTSTKKNTSK